MSLSMGCFKGLYRNQGIYWQDGAYNLDGSGRYPKIADARLAIDRMILARETNEHAAQQNRIANGAIVGERTGDSVTLHLPDGSVTMSIREFRRSVFDLEDQYGDIAFV